jgi:2-C-methyl-D-erythritol 2,4-cyclodiphosphate synthase
MTMNIRVGFGYDTHRFAKGRELWIGGVQLDYPLGLLGHSDADVLIHAICDALLGAANLRDIGYHFPDTSPEFKDADSKILLKKCISLIQNRGYQVGNIDATVCTEQPKLNPYIPAMQQALASLMEVDPDAVSIKATTSEKMGFVRRGEGITAYAVALIEKRSV